MAGGRPNMVRADTIDLQDQDAPTAAEHNKQIGSDGIAPHQAAQFQQVQNERRSEEETLADAWNMAGQHGKEQDANGQSDADAQKKADGNGATNAEGEDGSEDEDDDDDMMDRMSSSPSIEDGASRNFPFICTAATSRERLPAPQHGDHEPATFNQSFTPTPDSSPLVEVPRQLPLPRSGSPTPQSKPVLQSVADLSPTIYTPETSPLVLTAVVGRFYRAKSPSHRLHGRFDSGSGSAGLLDNESARETAARPPPQTETQREATAQQELHEVLAPMPGNAFAQGIYWSPESNDRRQSAAFCSRRLVVVNSSISRLDDPFFEDSLSLAQCDDLWDSDSSEDLIPLKDDDPDAFINFHHRRTDSGWGGECLLKIEDIDFEFVYALHTFVATVEGQANATKGDTMVLLDDSNSYWWLVRVVKDSSIGMLVPRRHLGLSANTVTPGYLPAEHIETPTERLARLNKHRNIDVRSIILIHTPLEY
jgi:hypothetical protein